MSEQRKIVWSLAKWINETHLVKLQIIIMNTTANFLDSRIEAAIDRDE